MKATEMTRTLDVPALIEQFGGLRPMATKTGIPVTTIQGWKKRNAIPENRFVTLRAAANQHGIALDDFLHNATAADMGDRQGGASAAQSPAAFRAYAPRSTHYTNAGSGIFNGTLNILLVLVALAALGILFWSQTPQPTAPEQSPAQVQALEEKIRVLETELNNIKTQQQENRPADWDAQMQALQAKAQSVQENLDAALAQAQTISGDVLGAQAGDLNARLQTLETHLQSLAATQALQGLWVRIQDLATSTAGQAQMEDTVRSLNTYLNQNPVTPETSTDQVLESARASAPSLAQTFADIPPSELKAAALLLAMNQFRSALGRDQQPFDQDLQLLATLTAGEDPALQEAFNKLAPQAQTGVLTPQGLSRELKTLAGDAVVASLRGENLSMGDQLKAQLSSVFQMQKAGRDVLSPAAGANTQQVLDQAQTHLTQGDVQGALALVQGLEGPAAQTLAPWINRAQATLNARQLGTFLGQSLTRQVRGGAPFTAQGGVDAPGELIQDDSGAINVLKRN